VGLESTISAFERVKIFHTLDWAAIVIGSPLITELQSTLLEEFRGNLHFLFLGPYFWSWYFEIHQAPTYDEQTPEYQT
jgi:hypothetical protein